MSMIHRFGICPLRLCVAMLALVLTACPERLDIPPPSDASEGNDAVRSDQDGFVRVSIFWASDRKPTGKSIAKHMLGNEHGELIYGTSELTVPLTHQLGEIERPSKILEYFGYEDRERHIVLLPDGTEIVERDRWLQTFRTRIGDPGSSHDRSAFVFIHGFNNTFEDAAHRTAQIAHDLRLKSVPILYSWPSIGGGPQTYIADGESARRSERNLVAFLKDLKSNSGAESITLIAHSMGARLLGHALTVLRNDVGSYDRSYFDEIVLAAPDIDAEVFKEQIVPAMTGLSNGRTMYASSEDWALWASRKAHARRLRAGQSGDDIVVMPGLETIDASNVNTDFIGHDTFATTRAMLDDIFYLVQHGIRANDRNLFERKTDDGDIYWSFSR
jgi:esterase/lipase superfamily enzyme